MRQLKKITLILILWPLAQYLYSQPIANPAQIENVFKKDYREAWSAAWITHPDIYLSEFAVIHFRKSFDLPKKPDSFIVHVSADNRYRLFVNGVEVCEGPQRSDLWHWRYNTINIAPYLQKDKNVLAAQVVNWGQNRAISQFSHQTGFLLQGFSEKEQKVDTGKPGWKTYHNQAFTPVEVGWRNQKHVRGYYAANPTDSVAGEKHPWGWQTVSYNDREWKNAIFLDKAYTREVRRSMWNLTPRTIPLLHQKLERFAEVERVEGADLDKDFIKGNRPLTIPAHSKVSILIDHSFLTMGYPELIVSDGEGASINVVYSEALYNENREKEHRDKVEGMHIWGVEDFFVPDGGDKRLFRPLWLRGYRYVQLNIETKNDPLVINDYYHVFSAYPLQRKGSFASNVTEHEKMTDLGWHSIEITTQENLMPDIYYEQGQAAYDGRIHANTIMYTTGDSLAFKDFIRQFDYSRLPDGLTQGYAPDRHHLIIATFSLYWVLAIHDYMMHFDDPEFVKEHLPGIQSVMGWYERNMQENGFLGPVTWWAFIDWYTHIGAPNQHAGMNGNSEAKGTEEGTSATYSLLLAYTFQKAAEIINGVNGQPYFFQKYNEWNKKINQGVYSACFDQTRGLLADTPEKALYSKHANIFGVLSGCIPAEQRKAVMEKVMNDESLTKITMPFYSNLWDALHKAGMAAEIPGQLDLWYGFLEWGLTTTPERPSISPRSDCHPWSSSPNYALPKFVAGIQPAEPGFKSVKIEPAPGDLESFETVVPHGKGDIKLEMKKEKGKQVFDVQLPAGLGGEFVYQGKNIRLKEGARETLKF